VGESYPVRDKKFCTLFGIPFINSFFGTEMKHLVKEPSLIVGLLAEKLPGKVSLHMDRFHILIFRRFAMTYYLFHSFSQHFSSSLFLFLMQLG
jgi:hypothetical protein